MGQAANWGRQELVDPAGRPLSSASYDDDDYFSLTEQITQRPLLSLGVALAAGFTLGWMTGGQRHDEPYSASSSSGPRSWEPSDSHQPTRYQSNPYAPATGASFAAMGSPAGDEGPGVIQTLQSGLNDSIRRGTGQAPGDLVGTLTAALTGLLVDTAKDLLDQNLPGFKERYEEAARTSGRPGAGAREFSAASSRSDNPLTRMGNGDAGAASASDSMRSSAPLSSATDTAPSTPAAPNPASG